MTIDGPYRVLCEFRVVCPPVSLAPLSIKARVTWGGATAVSIAKRRGDLNAANHVRRGRDSA